MPLTPRPRQFLGRQQATTSSGYGGKQGGGKAAYARPSMATPAPSKPFTTTTPQDGGELEICSKETE